MKTLRVMLSVAACSLALTAPVVVVEADESGCRLLTHCVSHSGSFVSEGSFVSSVTNNCGMNLHVKLCNRQMGSDESGASAQCKEGNIAPGWDMELQSFGSPTGEYDFRAIKGGNYGLPGDSRCLGLLHEWKRQVGMGRWAW